jgi:hypothetical protein
VGDAAKQLASTATLDPLKPEEKRNKKNVKKDEQQAKKI